LTGETVSEMSTRRPILRDPHGLEVVHHVTAAHAHQHLGFLGVSLGRNDQRHVPPERRRGRPPEQLLGRRVQDVMIPSSVSLTMASSDASTMAARRAAASPVTSGGRGDGEPARARLLHACVR